MSHAPEAGSPFPLVPVSRLYLFVFERVERTVLAMPVTFFQSPLTLALILFLLARSRLGSLAALVLF